MHEVERVSSTLNESGIRGGEGASKKNFPGGRSEKCERLSRRKVFTWT